MSQRSTGDDFSSEITEVASLLGSIDPLIELNPDELGRLVASVSVEYVRDGTPIASSGEPNARAAVIAKGALSLRDDTDALTELIGEGEIFGLFSAVSGKPVRFSTTAHEDSVLYWIPAEALREARTANAAFDRGVIGLIESGVSRDARDAATSPLLVNASDLVKRDVVAIAPTASIADAATLMSDANVSALIVADADNHLRGLVTERDFVRRFVARSGDTAETTPISVADIMTPSPVVIQSGESAERALMVMTEYQVRHLPVVDGPDSVPIGLLTARDLLRARRNDPVAIIGQLNRAETIEAIAAATGSVNELLVAMMRADATAETVGKLVSSVTDAATRRIIALAEAELGPPPIPYSFVCFGSQARQEQTARTDQDNAMILAKPATGEDAQYFAALADRVCSDLAEAGYSLCPGDIMATNPTMRTSLDEWQRSVDTWVHSPTPEAVLAAAVYFDVRHVWGEASLTAAYHDHAVAAAQNSTLFLGQLASSAAEFQPPLGFFRRFVVEKDGAQKDRFDLKAHGVSPVIEFARVYALAAGLHQTNTAERLRALGPTEWLAPDDAEDLEVAYEQIGYVRLQNQRFQIESASAPDNYVDPRSLSPLERSQLKRAFVRIDQLQDAMRRRFSVGSMG